MRSFLDASDKVLACLAARELSEVDRKGYSTAMLGDPRIITLLDELTLWPGTVLNSHKSSSQLFHKLVIVAELGPGPDNPRLKPVIERILESMDTNGMPTLPMGSNGQNAWALCDAPLVLHALTLLEVQDKRIQTATDHIASLIKPWGMPCVVSESLGSWRGPGKKSDPCPYASLVSLKLFLHHPERYGQEISILAETILALFDQSRTKHPYQFYMGTDFRKLKAPLFWYDILHVLDVLSRVSSVAKDERLQTMLRVVLDKKTDTGYVPESVYLPWKDWDFGQKTAPSVWLDFYIERIQGRLKT